MKLKIIFITLLVLIMTLVIAVPVLAGNGPQTNLGQNWKETPPGERDDSVHGQQIEANHPYGKFWVDWKRTNEYIPGWVKNGGPSWYSP